jgi:hypothetical protein
MISLIIFFLNQFTKLNKPFYSALDQPNAKVLPQGYWLTCISHAAEPGEQLHHGNVLFWTVDMLGSKKYYYSYVGNVLELLCFVSQSFFCLVSYHTIIKCGM